MDVGDIVPELRNDDMGVYDALVNVRNSGVGVRDVMMNVRGDYVCVYRELSLEADNQRWSHKVDGTHIEDVKDPVEVQPPGGDHLLIILRVEMSRDCISLARLDEVPLYLGHSPAIESLVSELPDTGVTGPTHVVNRSIASNTG